MSNKSTATIATMGIDIGKNSFHVIGLDERGAIVLRQKWSRGQMEARLANMPPCLIGMEACVGAHHLSRKLQSYGHDAWLMAPWPTGRFAGRSGRQFGSVADFGLGGNAGLVLVPRSSSSAMTSALSSFSSGGT
jgi:hypothetical protein